MQTHGIILVDEISVREALTVCSKTLTYKGLIDYGEEYKATDIAKKPQVDLFLCSSHLPILIVNQWLFLQQKDQ